MRLAVALVSGKGFAMTAAGAAMVGDEVEGTKEDEVEVKEGDEMEKAGD